MWLPDFCLLLSPGSRPHYTETSSALQPPPPANYLPSAWFYAQERPATEGIRNPNKHKATLCKVHPPWEPMTGFSQSPTAKKQLETTQSSHFTCEHTEVQHWALPRF